MIVGARGDSTPSHAHILSAHSESKQILLFDNNDGDGDDDDQMKRKQVLIYVVYRLNGFSEIIYI